MRQHKKDALVFPSVYFLKRWLVWIRTSLPVPDLQITIQNWLDLAIIEIGMGKMTLEEIDTSEEEIIFLHKVSSQYDGMDCWTKVREYYYPHN